MLRAHERRSARDRSRPTLKVCDLARRRLLHSSTLRHTPFDQLSHFPFFSPQNIAHDKWLLYANTSQPPPLRTKAGIKMRRQISLSASQSPELSPSSSSLSVCPALDPRLVPYPLSHASSYRPSSFYSLPLTECASIATRVITRVHYADGVQFTQASIPESVDSLQGFFNQSTYVSLGCDACRARKVRCTRDDPEDSRQSCKHCIGLGIPCTYDYQPKKRGPPNL
jgi:hypothetical protein